MGNDSTPSQQAYGVPICTNVYQHGSSVTIDVPWNAIAAIDRMAMATQCSKGSGNKMLTQCSIPAEKLLVQMFQKA
jgi:hypothetical protein